MSTETAVALRRRCPRCGRRSYHPQDQLEGYCAACHGWTGGDVLAREFSMGLLSAPEMRLLLGAARLAELDFETQAALEGWAGGEDASLLAAELVDDSVVLKRLRERIEEVLNAR